MMIMIFLIEPAWHVGLYKFQPTKVYGLFGVIRNPDEMDFAVNPAILVDWNGLDMIIVYCGDG